MRVLHQSSLRSKEFIFFLRFVSCCGATIPYNRMNTGNQGEFIVDRINGALSSLRRERDELHRKKELALERLKLVKEERLSVENVVQSMRYELKKLMVETSEVGRQAEDESLVKLAKEVERLSKEASFQHQELIAKKDILTHMENRIAQEQMIRDKQLQMTLSELRRTREKTAQDAKCESCPYDMNQCMNLFRCALNDNRNDKSFFVNLLHLIDMKASQLETESMAIAERNESLEKRVHEYKQLIDQSEMAQ